MLCANELELDIATVSLILKIAQKKGYIKISELIFNCDDFRHDKKNNNFEFHLLNSRDNISLDMNKFIECYIEFLYHRNLNEMID